MRGRNILVFGASGFIGSYLVDALLAQGCQVTASDIGEVGRQHYAKRNVRYELVDITDKAGFEKLKDRKFDAVVHLAACQPANVGERNYDPRQFINVNVIGTLNILEFCRQNQAGKIIYASSHRNTQALWTADKKAIREDDGRGIKFTGEYAMFSISESAAQDCVMHYHAQYGLASIVFRLPPVYGYGPHMEIFKEGKPIKTGFQVFIERAMASQPLEVWGDGRVGRDIVYVKAVVSAFLKAIDSETAQGLFNISSGKYLSLREQAETIARVFWGSATAPVFIERPDKSNGMDSFLYDIGKAKRELGWSPEYSFEDMLIDYQKESDSKEYQYLLEKRKEMLENN